MMSAQCMTGESSNIILQNINDYKKHNGYLLTQIKRKLVITEIYYYSIYNTDCVYYIYHIYYMVQ